MAFNVPSSRTTTTRRSLRRRSRGRRVAVVMARAATCGLLGCAQPNTTVDSSQETTRRRRPGRPPGARDSRWEDGEGGESRILKMLADMKAEMKAETDRIAERLEGVLRLEEELLLHHQHCCVQRGLRQVDLGVAARSTAMGGTARPSPLDDELATTALLGSM